MSAIDPELSNRVVDFPISIQSYCSFRPYWSLYMYFNNIILQLTKKNHISLDFIARAHFM